MSLPPLPPLDDAGLEMAGTLAAVLEDASDVLEELISNPRFGTVSPSVAPKYALTIAVLRGTARGFRAVQKGGRMGKMEDWVR